MTPVILHSIQCIEYQTAFLSFRTKKKNEAIHKYNVRPLQHLRSYVLCFSRYLRVYEYGLFILIPTWHDPTAIQSTYLPNANVYDISI